MTAWIYPAKDAEAYAELTDVDYDKWRQDEIHKLAKALNDAGDTIGDALNGIGGALGKAVNGMGEFFGDVGGKISKAVTDMMNRGSEDEKTDEESSEDAVDVEVTEAGEDTEKTEAPEDDAAPADASAEDKEEA